MTWKLRKAILEDKIKIEELFIKMLQSIYRTEDVSGYEEGYLDKFFDNRDEWICVAEDAGVVIGYLSIEVHHEKDEFIYLDDISVLSEYQNLGIGTELLKTAEQYAKDINIPRIVLHVEKSNESAFRLYERLGYVVKSEEGSRYRMIKDIIIAETERLILRRYRKSDLEDLFEYLSDAVVVKYEPYKPMDIKEVENNLEWRISTDEMIAVELKSNHKMIGNVYLGKREFETLEIGYVFHQEYWGAGYAKESCMELMKLAFANGVHRIYAECDPENESSWKLLEALGFEREAHLKQNVYFWKDDKGIPIWKDTYIYSKLNA